MGENNFDFKKVYLELAKKYNLPEYSNICEDFDIEKAAEKEDSFLLRDIRRVMNDKISAYLHLFETLINPGSSPVFIFPILREVSFSDKAKIRDVYRELARIEIRVMRLDCVYSEKAEADFIIQVFNSWQDLKLKINDLIGRFEVNFERDVADKNNSYFD